MLAVRVLQEQGVAVTGLSFKSYFFNTESARKATEQLGIELLEIDFSDEHLAMVKNPKYGYGKNINPCIDCHAMMIRKAGELLTSPQSSPSQGEEEKIPLLTKEGLGEVFDFIATGEVLGQRPKSQNKEALDIVAKYSGVGDLLIRPLSAKLLDVTEMEKKGLVNRGRLLDIKGRSRQRQMELAKKYGIKEYPSPAGGCLLTDPEFSQRLIKLFEYWPECDGNDVEVIKNGRVIWVNAERREIERGKTRKVLIVVGRDKEECEKLEKLAKKGDVMVELKEENGPLTIVRNSKIPARLASRDEAGGQETRDKKMELAIPNELKMSELKLGEEKSEEEILKIAGMLTGYYAPKARGRRVKLKVESKK